MSRRTTVRLQQSRLTAVLTVELNRHSRALLEKYKDVAFEGEKVVSVISNQKMNDYIKELGKLAGIDTKIRITQNKGHDRNDTI